MNTKAEDDEKLYSPSQWCGRRCPAALVIQKHVEFATEGIASLRAKNKFPHVANIRYGCNKNQLMDVFEPVRRTTGKIPTLVYIHGGYWQELNKDISSYCVEPLINAGIRVVIPDYDLAPSLSLSAIVKEIEELVKFLLELSFKREWKSLWLGGHSAGAHLAASILSSNLSNHIAGFILLSGIFDLRPLVTTSVNKMLQLSRLEIEELSPLLLVKNAQTKFYSGTVFLAVGEFDSPAFQDQQKCFAEALRSFNISVVDTTISNVDHFTLVENLTNENEDLTKRIIRLVMEIDDPIES